MPSARPTKSEVELSNGVRDFCAVLDQAAVGFYWNWIFWPKLESQHGLPRDEASEVVRNATIESSLVAIRAIDEFFSDRAPRPTDIRATDYAGFSSPGRFLEKVEFDLIGRRIAHLTVDRSDNEPWQLTTLIERACQPSLLFLEFILADVGEPFRPAPDFDVNSRLVMCRDIEPWMQKIMKAANRESEKTSTRLR